MAKSPDRVSTKFERVFEQLDEVRIDIAQIKVRADTEQKQIDAILVKIDGLSATLNQIVGKDSVRAAIYGVVGSIVAAVVAWLITLVKGGS